MPYDETPVNQVTSIRPAATVGAMTSYISHTSVDCRNAFELSEWWRQVLDYVYLEGDPNLPGHEECWIQRADASHAVLFIEVPEGKSVKNRIHFDLRAVEGTREEELDRLLALGATVFDDLRREDGGGWVTLLDPEGNEFCLLRSSDTVTPAS